MARDRPHVRGGLRCHPNALECHDPDESHAMDDHVRKTGEVRPPALAPAPMACM
jgi:hypothetical protein